MLGVREVATRLGVHRNTVIRMIGRGDLPATKVGGTWKVTEAELEQYLRNRASEGSAASTVADPTGGAGRSPVKEGSSSRSPSAASSIITCPKCAGRGCETCRGAGIVRRVEGLHRHG